VYNIFDYVIYITFIFIYPRLTDTLHPGNGGNPAFSSYDLDSSMRAFFYPAVIGWSILGFWLASLKIRYKFALLKLQDID
jgi:heme exporter protein C